MIKNIRNFIIAIVMTIAVFFGSFEPTQVEETNTLNTTVQSSQITAATKKPSSNYSVNSTESAWEFCEPVVSQAAFNFQVTTKKSESVMNKIDTVPGWETMEAANDPEYNPKIKLKRETKEEKLKAMGIRHRGTMPRKRFCDLTPEDRPTTEFLNKGRQTIPSATRPDVGTLHSPIYEHRVPFHNDPLLTDPEHQARVKKEFHERWKRIMEEPGFNQ